MRYVRGFFSPTPPFPHPPYCHNMMLTVVDLLHRRIRIGYTGFMPSQPVP